MVGYGSVLSRGDPAALPHGQAEPPGRPQRAEAVGGSVRYPGLPDQALAPGVVEQTGLARRGELGAQVEVHRCLPFCGPEVPTW